MEVKELTFVIPKTLQWKEKTEFAKANAQQWASDGWIADSYFNGQDSFFTKDGNEYARIHQRRWVQKKV